jgi:hypothetical protein
MEVEGDLALRQFGVVGGSKDLLNGVRDLSFLADGKHGDQGVQMMK